MNPLITQTIFILQASGSPDLKQRLTAAAIALVIALLIAWIGVSGMKGKLKSVKKQAMANQYVREGSMNLQSQNDLFLHKQVQKRPKAEKTPQNRA